MGCGGGKSWATTGLAHSAAWFSRQAGCHRKMDCCLDCVVRRMHSCSCLLSRGAWPPAGCSGDRAAVAGPTCEADDPAVQRPESLRVTACGQAAGGPHRQGAGQVQEQPSPQHGWRGALRVLLGCNKAAISDGGPCRVLPAPRRLHLAAGLCGHGRLALHSSAHCAPHPSPRADSGVARTAVYQPQPRALNGTRASAPQGLRRLQHRAGRV